MPGAAQANLVPGGAHSLLVLAVAEEAHVQHGVLLMVLPDDRRDESNGRNQGGHHDEIRREPIDVNRLVPAAGRDNPEKLIADLSRRVLQSDPPSDDLKSFTDFLAARKDDSSDATVRGLLHLMMSTPLYQLT